MNLTELVERLDEELNGRKGLFNKKTDLTRCLELVEEIKLSLPQSLFDAEEIVKNRDKILLNADVVAKNVIKEAELRAQHLADSSEVNKVAQRQAREVLEKAYKECDLLMQKTKEHLDKLFCDAEGVFINLQNVIKTNRNELRSVTLNNN